ncbi:MAG: VRR-NUC domain-containing protein [Pseudomonadota bacterium]
MDWRAPQTLTAGRAPPPDYYAANLRHLVAAINDRFLPLLDSDTRHFTLTLAELSTDAARLLARLLSRKGPVFREDRLCYDEVADQARALAELSETGLIRINGPERADLLLEQALLGELRCWFNLPPRARKRDVLPTLLGRHSDAQLRARLAGRLRWLSLCCQGAFERCQWLYFGDRYRDLSLFVTEDLGLLRYPRYRLSAPDWLTESPESLARHLQLRALTACSHRLTGVDGRSRALAAALAARLKPLALSREQSQVRDRALLRSGACLERAQAPELALAAYAGAYCHPARERQVRLLWRLGRQDAARTLQSRINASPWCAAEADFAARFQRRRRPLPRTRSLTLLGATPPRIEAFACALLQQDGSTALHLENHLPRGLTGLLYWPIIYASLPGAFTRPYQSAPNDLHWPDFARHRNKQIQRFERSLQRGLNGDPDRLRQLLYKRLEQHQGSANPLVHWGLWQSSFIDLLLRHVPIDRLLGLAAFVIRNLDGYRTGFPDLLVLGPQPARFELLEVKGPNDALAGHQRRWLAELERLGWPVQVLKLKAPPAHALGTPAALKAAPARSGTGVG